jgi:hypothetical protein
LSSGGQNANNPLPATSDSKVFAKDEKVSKAAYDELKQELDQKKVKMLELVVENEQLK